MAGRIGDMFRDWLDGGKDSTDNLDPDDANMTTEED
jgi:hypothetical protein